MTTTLEIIKILAMMSDADKQFVNILTDINQKLVIHDIQIYGCLIILLALIIMNLILFYKIRRLENEKKTT